jgi:hypothetical protein
LSLPLLGTATEQVGETLLGQRDSSLRRLARPLLECVEHVNGVFEFRDVETRCSTRVCTRISMTHGPTVVIGF